MEYSKINFSILNSKNYCAKVIRFLAEQRRQRICGHQAHILQPQGHIKYCCGSEQWPGGDQRRRRSYGFGHRKQRQKLCWKRVCSDDIYRSWIFVDDHHPSTHVNSHHLNFKEIRRHAHCLQKHRKHRWFQTSSVFHLYQFMNDKNFFITAPLQSKRISISKVQRNAKYKNLNSEKILNKTLEYSVQRVVVIFSSLTNIVWIKFIPKKVGLLK